MKSSDGNFATVLPRRTVFLARYGISPEDATLVHLVYQGDDYTRYVTADDRLRGDGMTRAPTFIADGIATNKKDLALFLPLADCIGAVLHDPVNNTLMISHLGRHNLVQSGGTKSVQYMSEQFACDPKDITIWLSPAARQENYPLYDFDGHGMHEVATEQLISAGVPLENITVSPVDVTTDKNYYSHSQFLKGKRPTDGRFALVAMLTSQ